MLRRAPGQPSRLRQLEASHSYGLVLVFVFVSFLFLSATPDTNVTRAIAAVLLGGTLLLAMWCTHLHPRAIRGAAVIVVVGIVASLLALFAPGESDLREAAVKAISALFVIVAPLTISRGVLAGIRERRRITLDAVFGVVCVYLLIGMAFAFVYNVITAISGPQAFSDGTGDVADHLYFSFVTLATVGYGDITPVSRFARTLAISEALIGQLYLVTVLSLIISNIGRRRRDAAVAQDPD